jgi:hypothetical protein
MDTLGPDGSVEHVNVLIDAEIRIDKYIASLQDLPAAIRLSDGRDLLEMLNFRQRIADANAHCMPFYNNVDGGMDELRDRYVPACRHGFADFAAAAAGYSDLESGRVLSDDTRDFLAVSLPKLQHRVEALGARLRSIQDDFKTFYGSLPQDTQTLKDLAGILKPGDPYHLAADLKLSDHDRQLAQDALSSSALTLEQDAEFSLHYAGDMLNSLSMLNNLFNTLGDKVKSVLTDIHKAEARVPAALERVWINTAAQQWQQLDSAIARTGF